MKKILLLIGKFLIFLTIIYFIWLPLSRYYLIFRLKLALYFLNIFGFYPKFDISEINSSMGEMFSFLPFLALMLAYYGKTVIRRIKEILYTGITLLFIEIMGRFFEKLYFFYPKNYLLSVLAVLFLATLRVAVPFIIFLYIVSKETQNKIISK